MKNLAIIFGSRSCEHEVSIISALQLLKAADRKKYNIFPIYISKNGDWFTGDPLYDLKTYVDFDPFLNGIYKVRLDLTIGSGALITNIKANGLFKKDIEKVITNIDCIIPVLHGMHGEDGTIQGLFELSNIPYSSSGVASSSIGMDKVIMKTFFRGSGFPVLDDVWFTLNDWNNKETVIKKIEEFSSYPLFIKPACLGSSIGVTCAKNREELIAGIELAFSFDRKVLVEKAIDNPLELNCSVLGDSRNAKASVIEMPITGGNLLGFMEKYMAKGASKGMASLKRILPAPIDDDLTKELQSLSVKIFKVLDCKGVVRIDYMLDSKDNKYFITEINTIPGSMSYYLWEKSGINYMQLVDILVEIAINANDEKTSLNYVFNSDILKSNIQGKLSSKLTK